MNMHASTSQYLKYARRTGRVTTYPGRRANLDNRMLFRTVRSVIIVKSRRVFNNVSRDMHRAQVDTIIKSRAVRV